MSNEFTPTLMPMTSESPPAKVDTNKNGNMDSDKVSLNKSGDQGEQDVFDFAQYSPQLFKKNSNHTDLSIQHSDTDQEEIINVETRRTANF